MDKIVILICMQLILLHSLKIYLKILNLKFVFQILQIPNLTSLIFHTYKSQKLYFRREGVVMENIETTLEQQWKTLETSLKNL